MMPPLPSPVHEQQHHHHHGRQQQQQHYNSHTTGGEIITSNSSCAQRYDEADNSFYYTNTEEDSLGMQLTSGKCVIAKDHKGLIGISIGGGAPHCPCVYVAQVMEKSAASLEGSLEAGDELVAINGMKCKGISRHDAVQLIRHSSNADVVLFYNKLHADVKEGKTLDIVLKKIKHRLVESIDEDTADALGLSRAIIANDALASKIAYLEELEQFYDELMSHFNDIIRNTVAFGQTQRRIGELFLKISVRESTPQSRAAQAFETFAHAHSKLLARNHIQLVRDCRPAFTHMRTILQAVLPDMKASLKKYLDTKFEYLSFCLKMKEMDEEEKEVYDDLQEALYRVASGNYEYRLVLRCRDQARKRFNSMRRDISQKLELLDGIHNKKLAQSLACFVGAQKRCNARCAQAAETLEGIFPIEFDVPNNAFQYINDVIATPTTTTDDDDDERVAVVEAIEQDDSITDFEQPPLVALDTE